MNACHGSQRTFTSMNDNKVPSLLKPFFVCSILSNLPVNPVDIFMNNRGIVILKLSRRE